MNALVFYITQTIKQPDSGFRAMKESLAAFLITFGVVVCVGGSVALMYCYYYKVKQNGTKSIPVLAVEVSDTYAKL